MNFWKTEQSIQITASAVRIWELWSDLSSWPIWDADVKSATLGSRFVKGAKGILKPVRGPKVKFELAEATPGLSFTVRSSLPFTRIDFIHVCGKPDPSGRITVTHRVEMSGLLTFLFKHIIGKNIQKGLPKTMSKLAALAEGNHV